MNVILHEHIISLKSWGPDLLYLRGCLCDRPVVVLACEAHRRISLVFQSWLQLLGICWSAVLLTRASSSLSRLPRRHWRASMGNGSQSVGHMVSPYVERSRLTCRSDEAGSCMLNRALFTGFASGAADGTSVRCANAFIMDVSEWCWKVLLLFQVLAGTAHVNEIYLTGRLQVLVSFPCTKYFVS